MRSPPRTRTRSRTRPRSSRYDRKTRVQNRDPRRARRGARAGSVGRSSLERTRQPRAASSKPRLVRRSASVRSACSTRRSPSWRSRAPPTGRRSQECDPSSKLCSVTSWRCPWTASSTRQRSSGTSARSRDRCRWWSAPRLAGRQVRRCPLLHTRHLVPGHPRNQDRVPVLTGRGKGVAEGLDPGRQPGDLPRAQASLLGLRPGARRPSRR